MRVRVPRTILAQNHIDHIDHISKTIIPKAMCPLVVYFENVEHAEFEELIYLEVEQEEDEEEQSEDHGTRISNSHSPSSSRP